MIIPKRLYYNIYLLTQTKIELQQLRANTTNQQFRITERNTLGSLYTNKDDTKINFLYECQIKTTIKLQKSYKLTLQVSLNETSRMLKKI